MDHTGTGMKIAYLQRQRVSLFLSSLASSKALLDTHKNNFVYCQYFQRSYWWWQWYQHHQYWWWFLTTKGATFAPFCI
jgi:hypothetical protein